MQSPNPKFPNGIDLDVSRRAKRTCVVALPYPAKRCGLYVVKCGSCGLTVMCARRPAVPTIRGQWAMLAFMVGLVIGFVLPWMMDRYHR